MSIQLVSKASHLAVSDEDVEARPEVPSECAVVGSVQRKAESKEAQPDIHRVCGLPLKWALLTMLTFQSTWQVAVAKLARAGSDKYLNSTVVLLAELCKMALSVMLLAIEMGSLRSALLEIKEVSSANIAETLKLSVPALAYTVQNNLLFLSLDNLSAAVQQITYQLKILAAAMLSVTMLGKTVGLKRWISLAILVLGVILVQLPRDLLAHDAATPSPPREIGRSVVGFGAVLAACCVSGFAGVFMEKVLKGTPGSIWLRNAQLASFGAVTAAFGVAVQDGQKVLQGGLTQGYFWGVVLLIITIATGGLMVAAVLKHADNILRQFSTALSILLTSILSATLLADVSLDLWFCIGGYATIIATFMYNGLLDKYMPHCLQDA